MKRLEIFSNGCEMATAGNYVEIDGIPLEELVRKNLPKLESYKNYPVKLDISIEFMGTQGLEVKAEGYELSKDKKEEE